MTSHTKSIKTIDSTNIATQKEAREFVKISERTVRVKYDSIFIRKGFNLRVDFGDLDELAESIETTGLQEDLTVDLLKDGTAVLTDGERRFRAIGLLRARSKELYTKYEYICVRKNDSSFNENDRIIAMMVHNSGKPFEPLEEAEGFRRLRDEHKMSITQIATRIGKAVPYVEQRLILADADDEEKQSVATKKISPTAQVELMRKERDPAKRKALVKASAAKGKTVRVKDVKQVPFSNRIDDILHLVTRISKIIKTGESVNLLSEVDFKLRELKRDGK